MIRDGHVVVIEIGMIDLVLDDAYPNSSFGIRYRSFQELWSYLEFGTLILKTFVLYQNMERYNYILRIFGLAFHIHPYVLLELLSRLCSSNQHLIPYIKV